MTLPPIYGPGPVYVKIEYSSAFGPHTMIRAIKDAWVTGADLGTVVPWSGGAAIAVKTMVTDLLDKIKVLYPSSVTFNGATLYTQPDPDVPATPQLTTTLAVAGTSVGTSWGKAVELSLTFRDTAFNLARLVLLDCPTGNDFDQKIYGDLDSGVQDVVNEFMSTSKAWASARGNRPSTFIKQTATLNEKLRRAYRMV